MSEVRLYGIERWGKTVCPLLEDYNQASGGAIAIWNFMANRFAGVDSHYFMDETALFRLAYQTHIPEHFRRVMLMTYDHAIILSEHVDQAVIDINLYLNEMYFPSNKVNHWAKIAEDLASYNQTNKYVGFGFDMYASGDRLFEGEEYKVRHLYKNKKIKWKEDGYFSVYNHAINRY